MNVITSKGPRIAVLGSCQVAGIGATLRVLVPYSEVRIWHIGVNPRETRQETFERLHGFDVVISQISDTEGGSLLGITRLCETFPTVVYLPKVVFRGFQPDCIYLHNNGDIIKGCLGDMHSEIIAAAYSLGLPEVRVTRLFNSLVYTTLGYFDSFAVARDHMLQTFAMAGYDLRLHMDSWLRYHGGFMYSTNHPRIFVLARLAQMAAERAGIVPAGTPEPTGVEDALANSLQWPIYPEIASRLGIPGSTTFIQPHYSIEPNQQRGLTLQEFVERSYQSYKQLSYELINVSNLGGAVAKMHSLLQNFEVGARSNQRQEIGILHSGNPVQCASNAQGLLRASEQLVRERRLDEADDLLRSGVESYPRDPWIARYYAFVAHWRGDRECALERFVAVRDRFPTFGVGRADVVVALLALGRADEAEAEASRAMKSFSDVVWVADAHAKVAEARGDAMEALIRWQRLRAVWPDHPGGLDGEVRALVRMGRYAEADSLAPSGNNSVG